MKRNVSTEERIKTSFDVAGIDKDDLYELSKDIHDWTYGNLKGILDLGYNCCKITIKIEY